MGSDKEKEKDEKRTLERYLFYIARIRQRGSPNRQSSVATDDREVIDDMSYANHIIFSARIKMIISQDFAVRGCVNECEL